MKMPEDYGITKYTWRDDLLDVHQNVNIQLLKLEVLPFNFGVVKGDFDCRANKLTSLIGSPKEIIGSFFCDSNYLTSLEFSPQKVSGDFMCNNNLLSSLKGSPKKVDYFNCASNRLENLIGCPEEFTGDFVCNYNLISSLEGCPKSIGGYFDCTNNKLKSLEFGPERTGGHYSCQDNDISDFRHFLPKSIEYYFSCDEHLLNLENLILLTERFESFYRTINCVANPDQSTTLVNLKKKLLFYNMVINSK